VRADRLIAVLLLLQTRGRVTAAQVARELEISERTARRDLEALGTAGVPVYSTVGRGGGWALVGGARTDLTGLTAEEARALFLAAGSAGRTGAPAPAAQAALRKLLTALPAPLRAGASAAGAAVVVDAAGWGRSAPPEPVHLGALQRAVVDGAQVVLGYTGRGKPPSSRTADPLGLVSKAGVWYLVAGTEAGVRTFRVERVTQVRPTGLPARRPPDFDLRAAWEEGAGEVERRRRTATVRALADPGVLPVLSGWVGARLAVGAADPHGRVEVEVSGPAVSVLVAELAGFGGRLEVVDPPDARDLLRALADELHRLYDGPPGDAGAPGQVAGEDGSARALGSTS
jgi:predicted DNA-binding transcriptional regulator YafY